MDSHYKISEKTLHLALAGSFVFKDNQSFREILRYITHHHEEFSLIAVELSGLEYIDSSGLGMLLLLRDSCEKLLLSLELHHPTGQVKRIFELSKIDLVITIKP